MNWLAPRLRRVDRRHDWGRWREVTRIYGAVISRAPEARAAAVMELCGDDLDLRAEVESLLAEDDASGIVDHPVTARASMLAMALPVQIGSEIGAYRIQSAAGCRKR